MTLHVTVILLSYTRRLTQRCTFLLLFYSPGNAFPPPHPAWLILTSFVAASIHDLSSRSSHPHPPSHPSTLHKFPPTTRSPPAHQTPSTTVHAPIPPAATLSDRPRHHNHELPLHIFFEVLGGLLGLAVLVGCSRCCYIYGVTPKRDRIMAILERHELDRELAALDRTSHPLRRELTPLPVYFPPPPTYENGTPPALDSHSHPSSARSTSPVYSHPPRDPRNDSHESPIPQPAIPLAPNG